MSEAGQDTGVVARPCAYRHSLIEPDGQEQILLSVSPENPWSHWVKAHRDVCQYTMVPLYAQCELDRLRTPPPCTEGWQPLDESTPKDTHVILAAQSANGWAVGEAVLPTADDDSGAVWWWADALPGEYHSDDVISMGAMPMAWQPLPPPPDDRTNTSGALDTCLNQALPTPSESVSAAVDAAVAAERERCAKVAETFHEDDDGIGRQVKRQVAAAIRSLTREAT